MFGIIRVALFFQARRPVGYSHQDSNNVTSYADIPAQNDVKFVVAFIFDWISSIVPTSMDLFIDLITIILLLKICFFSSRTRNAEEHAHNDETTRGTIRTLLRNKALRRFTTFECNCLCFMARPKFRFQLRLVLLIIFFTLRIVAIGSISLLCLVALYTTGRYALSLSIEKTPTVLAISYDWRQSRFKYARRSTVH